MFKLVGSMFLTCWAHGIDYRGAKILLINMFDKLQSILEYFFIKVSYDSDFFPGVKSNVRRTF